MNTTQLVGSLSDEMDDQHYETLWYVYGYANGLHRGGRLAGNPRVCLPDGTSPKQISAVFLKYANEHPVQWNLEAEAVMVAALASVFQCPAK